MTQDEINDFIDSLSAADRADLLAGLKLRDQRRTAFDVLMTASLLASHLRLLRFSADAQYVEDLVERVRPLTY